jgi:hypothetical protein
MICGSVKSAQSVLLTRNALVDACGARVGGCTNHGANGGRLDDALFVRSRIIRIVQILQIIPDRSGSIFSEFREEPFLRMMNALQRPYFTPIFHPAHASDLPAFQLVIA